MWVWWFVAALVLIVVEVLSLDLVLVMLASGAVAAGLAGWWHAGWWLQLVVFAVVAVGLLLALRPWLLARLRARRVLIETNVGGYRGRSGRTLTQVDATGGRVKLHGEVWTARTADGTSLAAGTDVIVDAIEGATAVVSAVTPSPAPTSD